MDAIDQDIDAGLLTEWAQVTELIQPYPRGDHMLEGQELEACALEGEQHWDPGDDDEGDDDDGGGGGDDDDGGGGGGGAGVVLSSGASPGMAAGGKDGCDGGDGGDGGDEDGGDGNGGDGGDGEDGGGGNHKGASPKALSVAGSGVSPHIVLSPGIVSVVTRSVSPAVVSALSSDVSEGRCFGTSSLQAATDNLKSALSLVSQAGSGLGAGTASYLNNQLYRAEKKLADLDRNPGEKEALNALGRKEAERRAAVKALQEKVKRQDQEAAKKKVEKQKQAQRLTRTVRRVNK